MRLAAVSGLLMFLASVIAVAGLRWADPLTSSFMVRERVLALAEGRENFRLHHRWVAWEGISPQAKLAVVAAEDQRFPDHLGFDFKEIAGSWEGYRRGGRLRGASTISQQLAKNLYLWPGRSYLRKALEAYLTALIEAFLPKRRILELYLNFVEFGEGIYGIGAASERFFRKAPSGLTPHEAALLAAVLPNPNRYSAARPSGHVLARQRWVLRQMQRLGGTRYLARL